MAINQPDLHLNYNLFQLRLTNDASTRFTGCNANDENWFKFGGIWAIWSEFGGNDFLLIEI